MVKTKYKVTGCYLLVIIKVLRCKKFRGSASASAFYAFITALICTSLCKDTEACIRRYTESDYANPLPKVCFLTDLE